MSYDTGKLARRIREIEKGWENLNSTHGTATAIESLHGVWHTLNLYYDEVNLAKKNFTANVKELRGIYAPDVAHSKIAEHQQNFDAYRTNIARVAMESVRAFFEEKEKGLSTMLATPPTDTQLALLQALSMRASNISKAELDYILPQFDGNYQAVKILQTIAGNSGVTVNIPAYLDCDSMVENLRKAKEYTLRAAGALDSDIRETSDFYFFYKRYPDHYDDIADTNYTALVDSIDNVSQLVKSSATKTALNGAEKIAIESHFKDIPSFEEGKNSEAVLAAARDAINSFPNGRELIRLSEYRPYLEIVEEAEKDDTDK